MPTYPQRWTVGEWTFFEVDEHGFDSYKDVLLYTWTGPGQGATTTYYETLEQAMAEAVAAKHMGAAGAGGIAVGTAAAWFMRMIGIDEVKPAGAKGSTALLNAFESADGFPAVGNTEFIERVERGLKTRGYVLAQLPEHKR